MMKAVNAKESHMVASWSVDRLGRSLTDPISISRGSMKKASVYFLHKKARNDDDRGRGDVSNSRRVCLEQSIIREQVKDGLARATANGVKLGRRRTKPSVEAQIVALRAKGDGIHKIRRKLGIGASVVQRSLRIAMVIILLGTVRRTQDFDGRSRAVGGFLIQFLKVTGARACVCPRVPIWSRPAGHVPPAAWGGSDASKPDMDIASSARSSALDLSAD
jgi:hypothetical protein